ncbi:hypothetical protein ACIHEJ_33160 [Streptomyces sp. NPDC052301]|uniref:hypothetical protein n=1 Tax=Streptomyces sp. NPDC052301 TaxID=3365687 RepID=UPI0037CDD2BB
MIDRAATEASADILAADPGRVNRELEALLASSPPVQNRTFPLPASAMYLRLEAANEHCRRVEEYTELLDNVLALYREDAGVRAFFGLASTAERLVDATRAERDRVVVARIDGYLDATTQGVRFLENNTDAPAGALFTPRINALVDKVQRRSGYHRPDTAAFSFDDDTAFARFLIGHGVSQGLPAEGVRIAVLQPEGAASVESVELVSQLNTLGADAFLADPRSVQVGSTGVRFARRPADLCWNKVNTGPWSALVETDEDLVDTWCRALRHDGFVHVNPMGSRYVTESKLSLAMVQEPGLAGYFNDEQRRLVASVLPWSRRLGGGCAHSEGNGAVAERPAQELVLKAPYDIRGEGVTVGRTVDARAWAAAVARGLKENHLVQEYVPPLACPVLTADGTFQPMSVSLDSFVWGGRFAGFGAKAGTGARVNVFQGGRKLAVRVVQEPPS